MPGKNASHHLHTLIAGAESGIAAGLSWWLAGDVLGIDQPLYAPVAAVVVIGAGFSRRANRAVAMLQGIGVAIVLSQFVVAVWGSGVVQIGLATALSVTGARLLTSDLMAVSYAGLNAAILVGLGGNGWIPDRLLEAGIGAGTAFALVYLVFPPHPSAYVGGAIGHQIEIATESLHRVASALRSADTAEATDVEEHSGEIERAVRSLRENFDFSQEVSRFSPWRWSQTGQAGRLRDLGRRLQPILRRTTTVIRVASRMAQAEDAPRSRLADALDAHREALLCLRAVVTGSSEMEDREEQLATLRASNDRSRRLAWLRHREDGALHTALAVEIDGAADEVDRMLEELEDRWSELVGSRASPDRKPDESPSRDADRPRERGERLVDALELLKQDHDEVRGLFEEFRSAADADETSQMAELAEQILHQIDTHTAIEERVFYPAVRDAGGGDLHDLVRESQEEQHVVTMLAEEVREMSSSDDRFKAKMTVLMKSAERHASEEEEDMFATVRDLMGEDRLERLGRELGEEKDRVESTRG